MKPIDASACVAVGMEAHRPVFASMRDIYGPVLFDHLRPDWEVAQSTLIESLCADPNAQGWVAENDGRVCAFVIASLDTETGVGDLVMFAVHPDSQRSGTGHSLIAASLDWLRGAGAVFVQAFIRAFPGHEPARRTLAKFGFTARAVQPTLLYVEVTNRDQQATRPPGVRQIQVGDVVDCVAFGLGAFRSVYASFERLYGADLFSRLVPDWQRAQSDYIQSAITAPEDETWVYEIEGRVVGFVVVKTDDHRVADIDLLAVDPTAQGRGVATSLNTVALQRCQELSMDYVVVATADDPGHAPARRSYEKAGFRPMPIQWNLQIAEL